MKIKLGIGKQGPKRRQDVKKINRPKPIALKPVRKIRRKM